MRTGGCGLQQALTQEAASVVKQAISLARQRGHPQVTPLHVANTMLAASTGLLRQACMKLHSHPLQCRALELCFSVALNRLPAATSTTPMSQHPSISHALVAAFKRAQAHQKRGNIENQQQQTLLAVKIELDQLIISILDDPSVSRVMREAGFSSIKVKNNLEKSISLELSSQSTSLAEKTLIPENEDVIRVLKSLMNRREKSIVIVGEHISSIESVVKDVIDKVQKGNVLDPLKEVKFITFPLFSFANLTREEVERKIKELTTLIGSLLIKGVVLYLGDLKWISDNYRVNHGEERFYCPIEHMIMELGRLLYGVGENGGFWLMGIATFETYKRCKSNNIGHHSLESVWGLHSITMTRGSLGLSLIPQSSNLGEKKHRKDENRFSRMLIYEKEEEKKLSCCADCSSKFEDEARSLSSLPSWLKDESKRTNTKNQSCATIKELREKWNSICNSVHKQSELLERSLTLPSTPSPSSSNSCLRMYIPEHSTSSSETMEIQYVPRFMEFNTLNLNILCNALEKKVPWQKEIIPEIVGTILQCRSGMFRREDHNLKQETWLFFQGQDAQAKEEIARELARLVFGSCSNFVSISSSNFSSKRIDSSEDYLERFSQEVSINPHRVFFIEDVDQVDYLFKKGIKRVIELGKFAKFSPVPLSFDGPSSSLELQREGVETWQNKNENITKFPGEEISLCDAIIILNSRSGACSPSVRQKKLDGSNYKEACKVSLDLNLYFSNETQVNDETGFLENVDKRVLFNINIVVE